MTISQKGLDLIKSQEGCILHPYLDQAGIATIGWGNTGYLNGVRVKIGDPAINQTLADAMLEKTVDIIAQQVDELFVDTINQNQFDALVDFAYNAGTGALQNSTLRKRINANPSDPTIRDAFMMWDKIHVDGELKVLDDLVNRRKKEADLYFT